MLHIDEAYVSHANETCVNQSCKSPFPHISHLYDCFTLSSCQGWMQGRDMEKALIVKLQELPSSAQAWTYQKISELNNFCPTFFWGEKTVLKHSQFI